MRAVTSRARITARIVAAVVGGCWISAGARGQEPELPLFKRLPLVLTVAELQPGIDAATVTDIELADLNGDGRRDLAVAWYATDNQDLQANRRMLSIYVSENAWFRPATQIDLYVLNQSNPAMSVFRHGTGEMGLGDFDGDGDLDILVTPLFGDELWFIENCGAEVFVPHLKFMFGFNSPANFATPPAVAAADFDSDGRDEAVYIVDPCLYLDGTIIHFWHTGGAVADMYRLDWEGWGDNLLHQWTRGLAVTDFDGDGRLDLLYSGAYYAAGQDHPLLTVWYGLDPVTGYFGVQHVYPGVFCSDVVAASPHPNCPSGVVLTDLDGTTMQQWAQVGHSQMLFAQIAQVTGYAGLSPNRGMGAAIADLNGDGSIDLVTKQKLGKAQHSNQIEITLSGSGCSLWTRVAPTPIDTTGFTNQQNNEILRPRNLAVADLRGNTRPEIVAGFAMPSGPGNDPLTLQVALWENSCLGDVNADGRTECPDLTALQTALGTCAGDPQFNPDADLDKDGCVRETDLALAWQDIGCSCWNAPGQRLGDLNCDDLVNLGDIPPFVLALSGQANYQVAYPHCNWFNADCNLDGTVSMSDLQFFLRLICQTSLVGPD